VTPISPNNLAPEKVTSASAPIVYFKLASKLMYTNRQMYREFSGFTLQRIHHLRLAGDFQWGIRSTHQTLDYIKSRPWLFCSIRTVRIRLRIPCDKADLDSFWENPDSWLTYPELLKGVREAYRSILRSYGPGNYAHDHRRRQQDPQRLFPVDPRIAGARRIDAKPPFIPHYTLTDLARILEGFPLLSRMDIEPDTQNLLMLWPDPMATMKCFEPLHAKEIDVIMILK
jgi:hypothetical protein